MSETTPQTRRKRKTMKWSAELIEIIEETPDVRTFKFDKPEGFEFIPGQYVMIYFPDTFGKKNRAYSIASSPTDPDYLEITIKLYGLFTHHMFSLREGSTWVMRGPYGKFVMDLEDDSDVLLLGAGVGVTPLMSMLRYAVDMKLQRNYLMLYSNKRPKDIIFHNELREMERTHPNIRIVYTLTRLRDDLAHTWHGIRGRINTEMVRNEYLKWQESLGRGPDYKPVSYACGPIPMLETQEKVLLELGWEKERIRYEKFW